MELRKIPKKAYEYAESLFDLKGQLQYKRKGRHLSVYCTACGTLYEGVTELGDTLEQRAMERLLDTPVSGEIGICPICKAKAEYKAIGRIKRDYTNRVGWMIGQRMGQDFIFRIFETEQSTWKEGKTTYTHLEYGRVYLQRGKKAERTYLYYSGWTGQMSWHTGYYSGKSMYVSNIYPDTYKEIQKTPMLKYGIPERWNLIDYYSAFSRYPDMEMVQKLGMDALLRRLIAGPGANINQKGKTIWDRLRIYKERMPMLKESGGSLLGVLQNERRLKEHWTQKQMEIELYLQGCVWNNNDRDVVREILKHTTLDKLKRYRKEQEQKNIGFQIYLDYIRMKRRAGYDISNSIALFPKDLRRRHDEMVLELRNEMLEKRKAEALQKYVGIAERYNKLDRKYHAELGEYIIRPARNAAEIIEEGHVLHHCVGSDNYLSAHDKGTGIILFLRKAEEADTPFCTIEIRGTKIEQWYEAYDQQPDKDILQPLLDNYVKGLEGKRRGRTRNTVSAEL